MVLRNILLRLSLCLAGFSPVHAGAPSVVVYVDGDKKPLSGAEVTVPHSASVLRFFVKSEAPRARFKLDGLDEQWRERSDDMFFSIRFLNHKGDQISQESFPVRGQSNGWKGSVAESAFIQRREVIKVPSDAERMTVVMSSAGPASIVGIYAVSGISIRSRDDAGATKRVFMQDSRVPGLQESNLWIKSGTHPSMATVTRLDDASDAASPVFVITDDDIGAHADWITGISSLPEVTPGESLELQWQETYSVGMGGYFSTTYERLPARTYRFVVEEMSITGTPLRTTAAISVHVPIPYWKNPGFWAAVAVLLTLLSVVAGRLLIRKKINRHLQQAQMIADERLRIARDLHDDLGTRLSHISMLGSYAESKSPDPEARATFGQITAMSRELISALSETVWMLNPKNNQLEALVDFLCRLVSELCRLAEIRCRIDAMSVTQNLSISHDFRHNVSLAVKEIVNNALRHSHASEIKMTIQVENNLLKIRIADDGVGLSSDARKNGLGLENISQRMKSIRGRCVMSPLDDGGLEVSLEAPIA